MTLPYSVVCDSPIQVRPVIVMQKLSIDSLQKQVHMSQGKVWEVFVSLWGGARPPPPMRTIYTGAPIGVSPSLSPSS